MLAAEPAQAEGVTVHVLFTDGARISFPADPELTVSDLLVMVQKSPDVAIPPDSSVLLLYRGKILDVGSSISQIEPLLAEFTIHCFFRANPKSKSLPESRGFDRLLSLNYSADEVSVIRQNFHEFQGTESSVLEDERFEIEDEWYPTLFSDELPLDILLPDGESPSANQPHATASRRDPRFWLCFVFGFLLGFYFGAGALFFMSLTYRNRKVLWGTLVGACLHYASNVVRE